MIHPEKQLISTISFVIEQRKNEFDGIAKVWFFPNLFLCLARVISLSGHLSRSIYGQGVDITSTQNLLISFNSILYKLNYSHVIIYMTTPTVLPYWRRIPLRRGLLDTTLCDKVLSVTCGRFVVLSEYVLRFPPPIKLTAMIQLKYCWTWR